MNIVDNVTNSEGTTFEGSANYTLWLFYSDSVFNQLINRTRCSGIYTESERASNINGSALSVLADYNYNQDTVGIKISNNFCL